MKAAASGQSQKGRRPVKYGAKSADEVRVKRCNCGKKPKKSLF